MTKQVNLNNSFVIETNINDKYYTEPKIAKKIIEHFKPQGKILDSCCGKGAFLNNLPKGTLWCEIDKGVDFFDFKEKVDYIITNPPYSIYDKFLDHSFKVSDNIIFLIPLSKMFSSVGRIKKIYDYGGIKEILLLGSGQVCGFPFGFPCGAVHYKRGYKGDIKIVYPNWKEVLKR